jgi:hypothetical protein
MVLDGNGGDHEADHRPRWIPESISLAACTPEPSPTPDFVDTQIAVEKAARANKRAGRS